jgi:hypothetical protein
VAEGELEALKRPAPSEGVKQQKHDSENSHEKQYQANNQSKWSECRAEPGEGLANGGD